MTINKMQDRRLIGLCTYVHLHQPNTRMLLFVVSDRYSLLTHFAFGEVGITISVLDSFLGEESKRQSLSFPDWPAGGCSGGVVAP